MITQLPLIPLETITVTHAPGQGEKEEEGPPYRVSELKLELVTLDDDRDWCRAQLKDHHYLHRDIISLARPLYYLVRFRGEPAGVLVYGRMQSSRCRGWYGKNMDDVVSGWAPHTQWELLTLMRMWLDPRIQRGGEWFIPSAASYVISQSLKRIHFEYLRAFPPVFFDEPWQIREVISYCDTRYHRCSLYLASGFQLRRENRKGLRTYARPLAPLTSEQKRLILNYARLDARGQTLREAERAVEEERTQPAVLRRHRRERKVA